MPLCLNISTCMNIHGYSMLGNEIKVLAYADDVAFFCVEKRSVELALSATEDFCDASGAAVNMNKCGGFWFGSWATKPCEFAGMSWSSTEVTYLGVPLSAFANTNSCWSSVANKMRNHAGILNASRLSMFGSAAACNVFLIAKLWYALQVMHCTRSRIQVFHRIFATFIWGSPWEPIRRDNLFRPVLLGGLGLVHLFVRQIVSRFLFL